MHRNSLAPLDNGVRSDANPGDESPWFSASGSAKIWLRHRQAKNFVETDNRFVIDNTETATLWRPLLQS